MTDYLTTREIAELLRIKERKVYDLAASGQLPCTKATGKLLFPSAAVQQWLKQHSSGPVNTNTSLPDVFLGSHDPLLEWALKESESGLPVFFDGSADGLKRFCAGQGIATGLHLYDPQSKTWNIELVKDKCASMSVVLIEWARRQRGLILNTGLETTVSGLADIRSLKISRRQPGAGAQHLFEHLLMEADIDIESLEFAQPVRSEVEAALDVYEGRADVAFGLASMADQYKLGFLPVIEERFDLLVNRRSWFEPPMQQFLAFCQSPNFTSRASEYAGYDITGRGTVQFNA